MYEACFRWLPSCQIQLGLNSQPPLCVCHLELPDQESALLLLPLDLFDRAQTQRQAEDSEQMQQASLWALRCLPVFSQAQLHAGVVSSAFATRHPICHDNGSHHAYECSQHATILVRIPYNDY